MIEKKKFLLDERLESSKEISYSIFHCAFNSDGGSIDTPIGRIEIKRRQSGDGFNEHTEIRILMRNGVFKKWRQLKIIKSPKKLNRIEKIISKSELNKIIKELIEVEKISEPYTIYNCIENVEDYRAFGKLYNWD
ncbi:hypothetical protein MWU58_12645 [Flavobacteriaceae bacterium S0825]|uniref:hypothetical protein n=1 Tax=Gaetbulibacter sp. S0825 TaxID=2720084 RepID=UPI00142FF7AB|nr:hypothetical protein [Gaetbulibacter sp. S0825]MCK0110148.1 hypothetical protein [Flavobacteriaceae bacterium S0825]NIX65777.1 hypothetical protein [Gaetbulibacter sp. S0825]